MIIVVLRFLLGRKNVRRLSCAWQFMRRVAGRKRYSFVWLVPAVISMAACQRADEVCSGDTVAMGRLAGHYAAESTWQIAVRDHVWAPDVTAVSALTISPEGAADLTFGWHKQSPRQGLYTRRPVCVRTQGDELLLSAAWFIPGVVRAPADPFRKIAPTLDAARARYLSALVEGCYKDGLGREWCFTAAGELRTAKNVAYVELVMDPTEVPGGGFVLQVSGDALLWHFAAQGRDGFVVRRTRRSTDPAYVDVLFQPTWLVLRRR